MQKIDAQRLEAMQASGEDFVLLNVLPEASFQEQHIPGSDHAEVQSENFVEQVEQLAGGKDRRIVVYCSSPRCVASRTAARKLEQAGFTDVWRFPGGLEEWSSADRPLRGQAA